MINNETTIEGQSHTLEFSVKDTQANEVMMAVFNAVTELVQSGAENVRVTVEKLT